jgi:hypothetical protein
MSAGPIRRAACALADYAVRVAPGEHADWARAMRSEIDHIGNDSEALRWALGCIEASWRMRSESMSGPVLIVARIVVAGLICLMALEKLLPAIGVLAYKAGNRGVLAAVETTTPGGDFNRFAPLIERMPTWQLPLNLVCVALYLSAAVALLFGWRRAMELFLLALGLQLAGLLLLLNDVDYAAARNTVWSAAELRTDVVFLILYGLIAAGVIWVSRQAGAGRPV